MNEQQLREALAHVDEHGFGDLVDADAIIEQAAREHLTALQGEEMEPLRTCDECGDTEEASAYPDWVHGRCMDCEMVDVRFYGATIMRDVDGNTTEGTHGVFDPDLLEVGSEAESYVHMTGVVGDQAREVLANNTTRIDVNELIDRLQRWAPFDHLEPSGEGTIAYRADAVTRIDEPYVDAVYVSAESEDVVNIVFAGLMMR